jgi:hypothetical protein
MQDVAITPLPIDWLGAVIGSDRLAGVRGSLMRLRGLLSDRTVWTVNSTAVLGRLLDAPRAVTEGLGVRAKARVRAEFLDDRQLLDWAALLDVVLAGHQAA